jgi:hypothetical protein
MLAAVGEINGSGISSDNRRVVAERDEHRGRKPGRRAALGHYQYEHGSCAALVSKWDKTGWGALMPKILGACRTNTRLVRRDGYRQLSRPFGALLTDPCGGLSGR